MAPGWWHELTVVPGVDDWAEKLAHARYGPLFDS